MAHLPGGGAPDALKPLAPDQPVDAVPSFEPRQPSASPAAAKAAAGDGRRPPPVSGAGNGGDDGGGGASALQPLSLVLGAFVVALPLMAMRAWASPVRHVGGGGYAGRVPGGGGTASGSGNGAEVASGGGAAPSPASPSYALPRPALRPGTVVWSLRRQAMGARRLPGDAPYRRAGGLPAEVAYDGGRGGGDEAADEEEGGDSARLMPGASSPT